MVLPASISGGRSKLMLPLRIDIIHGLVVLGNQQIVVRRKLAKPIGVAGGTEVVVPIAERDRKETMRYHT